MTKSKIEAFRYHLGYADAIDLLIKSTFGENSKLTLASLVDPYRALRAGFSHNVMNLQSSIINECAKKVVYDPYKPVFVFIQSTNDDPLAMNNGGSLSSRHANTIFSALNRCSTRLVFPIGEFLSVSEFVNRFRSEILIADSQNKNVGMIYMLQYLSFVARWQVQSNGVNSSFNHFAAMNQVSNHRDPSISLKLQYWDLFRPHGDQNDLTFVDDSPHLSIDIMIEELASAFQASLNIHKTDINFTFIGQNCFQYQYISRCFYEIIFSTRFCV
jgi:hypothetical protein